MPGKVSQIARTHKGTLGSLSARGGRMQNHFELLSLSATLVHRLLEVGPVISGLR